MLKKENFNGKCFKKVKNEIISKKIAKRHYIIVTTKNYIYILYSNKVLMLFYVKKAKDSREETNCTLDMVKRQGEREPTI